MDNHKGQVLVTFIVLGWNNKPLLDNCFKSIQKQTYKKISIIYVDNDSSDGSLEHVKKKYPKVSIIDAGKNLGFAVGNNLGIVRALQNRQCRYVVLLNTDARLAADWLAALVPFAQQHTRGASFQSPTLDYFNHKLLDSRGIKIDRKGRAIQLGHRENVAKQETKRVFGVNAAAALYSRAFLEAQPFGKDYFDSDLWMYLEDVDFAARATVMGWENWFVNKSCAYHMGSASSSNNPGFSVFLIYRNNFLMLVKNLPLGVLIRVIPGAIVTDLKTLGQLLRSKNFATAKAILRGRLYSLPLLPKFYSKRRQLKPCRKISRGLLRQLMNAQ